MKFSNLPLAGSALALGAIFFFAPQSDAAEGGPKLSPVDEQFIQQETASGRAIVRIAGEAAVRGESESVRALARSLVREHEKFNAELVNLAELREVDLKSGDFEKHEAHFDQLRNERAAAFDNAFVALMIQMHKESIESFIQTATDSPDADLKRWAEEKLPGLKAHLEEARILTPSKTANIEPSHLIVL